MSDGGPSGGGAGFPPQHQSIHGQHQLQQQQLQQQQLQQQQLQQQQLQGGGYFSLAPQYRPNAMAYGGWPSQVASPVGSYLPLDVLNGGGSAMNSALLYQQQSQQLSAERQYLLFQQQQQLMAAVAANRPPSTTSVDGTYSYGLMGGGFQPMNPFLPPQGVTAGSMGLFGHPATTPPGYFNMQQSGSPSGDMSFVDSMAIPLSYTPQIAAQSPTASTVSNSLPSAPVLTSDTAPVKQTTPSSSSSSSSSPLVKPPRPQPRSGLHPGEHECWISPVTAQDFIIEAQSVVTAKVDPSPVLSTLSQSSPLPPNFQHLITSVSRHTVCQVCFESQRPARFCFFGDFLIECSDCQIVVHRRCYGVHRMFDNSPNERTRLFLCDVCRHMRVEKMKSRDDSENGSIANSPANTTSTNNAPAAKNSTAAAIDGRCIVCYRDGGPRKKTSTGDWVHVYCALLSPQAVRIRDLKNMSRFEVLGRKITRPLEKKELTAIKTEEAGSENEDAKTIEPKSEFVAKSESAEPETKIESTDDGPEIKNESGDLQTCQLCESSLGFFLCCQAEGCDVSLHPYCLRMLMHEYEQEGKNQISTCVELNICHDTSTSRADLVLGPGGIVRVFCPAHAPQPKYCRCRRPFDSTTDASLMVGCDVCGDWLHGACIGAAAAECAVEADHYQCTRCVSQRLHLAMLDREWASIPTNEEATTQSRQLLAAMLTAASVAASSSKQLIAPGLETPIPAFPGSYELGCILPEHTTPLPFPDMLLIVCAWSIRVDLLLSADRIPIPSRITRPTPELPPPVSSPKSTPPVKSSEFPSSMLKKIQLKKKSVTTSASAASTPTPGPKSSTVTVDLKKKKALAASSSRPDLASNNSGPPAGRVLSSSVKPCLTQRAIIKKPGVQTARSSDTGVKPIQPPTRQFCSPKLGKPTTLGLKKRLPTTVGMKPNKCDELTGTTTPVIRRRPTDVKSTIRPTEKSSPPSSLELPFLSVCHLASMHRLASAATALPVGVCHWLKDLSACIARCETWVNSMTKALENGNIDQMQSCLQSHSTSVIQQLVSVKSEPRPMAMTKIPTINRIARLCLSVSLKPTTGPIVSGALSNVTSDAIALRCRAAVEIFLDANRAVLDAPTPSLSMAGLKQIVADIESKPELESLKQRELYIKSQRLLKRVQECSATSKNVRQMSTMMKSCISLQLKALPKAQLSEIEALVDEVRNELPGDSNVDLFTLPELLSRGRSLESQIDWASLKSMRDVSSQIQHMPISSPIFSKLQKILARVDAWRRDFQRVVSLMRSSGGVDGVDGEKSAHRKNVVVSGQSGFLKDLFSAPGGNQGGCGDGPDESDCRNFTQSQTVDEARVLLDKGLELSTPCEEVSQLRNWVNDCDLWSTSVQEALKTETNEAPSWDTDGLREFQRRQPLLPFAVHPELNSRLKHRIEQLEKIESNLLESILCRHQSVQQLNDFHLSTIDLLLRGAELSADPTRANRLRELKGGLQLRLQRFESWRNLVEVVLTSTDHLLQHPFILSQIETSNPSSSSSSSSSHDEFQCDVQYPPAPYLGNVISYPLTNTAQLVQGHWFGFSDDELLRLRDTVSTSIRIADSETIPASSASLLTTTDEYDDDLFELDNSLQSIISGVDVIKRLSQKYNEFRDSPSKSLRIQIQHAVIVIVHFIVLCSPDLVRQDSLFPFLNLCIAPLLLGLGFDGRSVFAALLPGPADVLRRLIRSGGLCSSPSLSSCETSPSLSSEQWTRVEHSWRFFQIDADPNLIARSISRLVGLWVLTAKRDSQILAHLVRDTCSNLGIQSDVTAEAPSEEGQNNSSSQHELADLVSLLFSSGAQHQLSILSALRGFNQICNHRQQATDDGRRPFDEVSLEFHLRHVLQRSTWHIRASRVADILSQSNSSVALAEVCDLLDEYDQLGTAGCQTNQERPESNSDHTSSFALRNHLKTFVDDANLWLQKVHERLLQPCEALIFVPQLHDCWPHIVSFISSLRPDYILLGVVVPEGQTCQLPNVPVESASPLSVAAIYTTCTDWDRPTWDRVLTALQWQNRDHHNLNSIHDLSIINSNHFSSSLLSLQQTALLSVCGDLQPNALPHQEPLPQHLIVQSISDDQHFQAFQDAITSGLMLSQPHCRMTDDIRGPSPIISQLQRIIDSTLLASPKTSIRSPLFFCPPGLQGITKSLSSSNSQLQPTACSSTELGWTRILSACLIQGWASNGVVIEQTGYPELFEEQLLDDVGIHEIERKQRCLTAALAVGSRLTELTKERSSQLKQLFISRPTLCRSTDQACRLLTAQLRLCEWTEAAISTLIDQDIVPHDVPTNVPVTLSHLLKQKSHIERLTILSSFLEHLKESLKESFQSSSSVGSHHSTYASNHSCINDVVSAFCGDSKIDNLGGFLALEIQGRLMKLHSVIDSAVPNFSPADMIKQSIIFKQILFDQFQLPAIQTPSSKTAIVLPNGSSQEFKPIWESQSDKAFQILQNKFHSASTSVDLCVVNLKSAELAVLGLFKLLLILFLKELLRRPTNTAGRDRSTLLNNFIGMLPQRLFDYLKAPAPHTIGEQSQWIPKVKDLGLLHISDSVGILAVRMLIEPTTLPPAPAVIFGESGATEAEFSFHELPSDGHSSVPEVLFLHPRCLFSLTVAVDLESSSSEPWASIVETEEVEGIASRIALLDDTIQIERIKEFSLQALVKFILSRIIRKSSAPDSIESTPIVETPLISGVLMVPLKILNWRLTTLPYLFPRVVPHDLLESFIRDFQQLLPAEEQLIIDTAVPLPTDTMISQLLHHHHLFHLIGNPSSVSRILPLLADSSVVMEQASHLLTRKPILPPEEFRELTSRFNRTAAVMFEFARHQREVGLSNSAGQESITTHLPIESLTITAQRILREQLVMHAAVESLYVYLEELSVWNQTTKHVLERLQARQETQHRLLECIKHSCSQYQCSPEHSFNGWNVRVMTSDFVQLIWDSYGLSPSLDCFPTVPNSALLGFPDSIVEFKSLKVLHDRGESLSCSIRDAHLEALQRQLVDVIRALEHLNTQSLAHISVAVQTMQNKDANNQSVTRDQLELLLQQSLFANLPTHPRTKDLFKRIVEVEYLATLAFSESNVFSSLLKLNFRIPDIKIDFPKTLNSKLFHQEDDVTSQQPTELGLSVAWTDLVALIYEKSQSDICPIPSGQKLRMLKYCWISSVRVLFVTGDPMGSPVLPDRPYRTPSYKTIQTLHSIGRQLFESSATGVQTSSVGSPPELKLLKVLLAAAKSFLTDAKASVDQWVRFRLILHCFPLYLREEMRVLRTRLQQRLNIFIEVVTKDNQIREIQLFKEGQLRQRYVPPPGLPDGDKETDGKKAEEADSNISKFEVIPSILRRASSCRVSSEFVEQKEEDSTTLFDRIRSGVRVCISTIFGDGEQSASERETVLFEAVGQSIDEEYFKGFHQLLIKKLQQSISIRKPVPNSAKQRGVCADSSLEDLLSSPPKFSSSNKRPSSRPTEEAVVERSIEDSYESPITTITTAITDDEDLLPLESAGFLWHGRVSDGTSINVPLWIVPLFSPVPAELRAALRSSSSFSFDHALSVSQFAGHLAGGGEGATRLHVLLGADWASEVPEVKNLVRLLRPKTLVISSPTARSQLTAQEAQTLQDQALGEAIQVPSFSAVCDTDPDLPAVRLWIVPPAPTLTESTLPSNFPKSSQLVFGVLELYHQRVLSVVPKNHPLGLIRSVATTVTQAITELQKKENESIPQFVGLRITVLPTNFEFILTQTKPDLETHQTVQSVGQMTDVDPFIPSRIPKRARLGDCDEEQVKKVPPWQQRRGPELSSAWAENPISDPYSSSGLRQPEIVVTQATTLLATSTPPWQRQTENNKTPAPAPALPFAVPAALKSLLQGAAAQLKNKQV